MAEKNCLESARKGQQQFNLMPGNPPLGVYILENALRLLAVGNISHVIWGKNMKTGRKKGRNYKKTRKKVKKKEERGKETEKIGSKGVK
jgi:hypothetical protein